MSSKLGGKIVDRRMVEAICLRFVLPLAFLAFSIPTQTIYASQEQQESGLGAGQIAHRPLDEISTIGRIQARGNLLIVGVHYDYKPFGFIDEEGVVGGFEVELVAAMAELWGVEVTFVPVSASDRVQKLAAGAVDLVAASLAHTADNEALIDFSQSYFVDGQQLLVRDGAGIEDVRGLDGMSVAVVRGSIATTQVKSYAQSHDSIISVLPFQEYPQAIAALKAGQVDAVAAGGHFLAQIAADDPELVLIGEFFTKEPYGFGVAGGDSYFRNLVDYTLQSLIRDGEYDRIYQKWFPASRPYLPQLISGKWPHSFAQSPLAVERPSLSLVEQVQIRGQLLVGTRYDFPPFSLTDSDGIVRGFDIDIAHEFAERWLGDPTAVTFVPVMPDNRLALLASGQIDLLLTALPQRQEWDDTIDFSQSYFLDRQGALTTRDRDRAVDIESDAIALPFETFAQAILPTSTSIVVGLIDGLAAFEAISIELIDAQRVGRSIATDGVLLDVQQFQEYSLAIRALKAGKIDLLVGSHAALSQAAQNDSHLQQVDLGSVQELYTIGLPNYDEEFRDLVNFTLQEMKEDGTYDRLHLKWFGVADPPYPLEHWSSQRLEAVSVQASLFPTSPSPFVVPIGPTIVDERDGSTGREIEGSADSGTASLIESNIEPTTYRVRAGDLLLDIAQDIYGNQNLWTVIYEANRERIGPNPNILTVGTVLVIPEVDE